MSLLTDTDLGEILSVERDWPDKNRLHIFPFEEDCLTPIGYDVRAGKLYVSTVSPRMNSLAEGEVIKIRPGDTVLIETLEDIGMPMSRSISAFITSKVSKVSKGLSHISTNIDADWRGKLLIAMHNPSRNIVSLGSACRDLCPRHCSQGKRVGRLSKIPFGPEPLLRLSCYFFF